jgi:quinol monooxygenase YgiN
MTKTVVAKLAIAKGLENKFIELSTEIVSQSKKEAGCISYNLYKECFSEKPVFLFFEEYRDDEALSFHNNSEYLKSFFEAVTPLLDGEPSIKTI